MSLEHNTYQTLSSSLCALVSETLHLLPSTIGEADQVHVDTATAEAEDTRRRKTWSSRSVPKTGGLAPHSWPHATVHTGLYVYFYLFFWPDYICGTQFVLYMEKHTLLLHIIYLLVHILLYTIQGQFFFTLHYISRVNPSQIITFSWSRHWFARKFYGLKFGHI